MRHLAAVAGLAFGILFVPALITATPTGCATLKPVTDTISAFDVQKYAQNALLTVGVLESISRTIDLSPEKRKLADTLFARAKVAIDAATKACEGVTELSRAQVDQAFSDFKGLYNDAMALLGPYGVHRVPREGRAGAAPGGGFSVADPLVFGS